VTIRKAKVSRVEVRVLRTSPRLRYSTADATRVVETVFRGERHRSAFVSLVFTTSRFIHGVNRRFLKHDHPTDVITFPLRDSEGTPDEIYVNLDYARSQARQFGVTVRDEVRRLIVHGCLHLLGYDDHRPSDRKRMKEREDRYVGTLAQKTF